VIICYALTHVPIYLSHSREAEMEDDDEYYNGTEEGADALAWHAPGLEVLEFTEERNYDSELVGNYYRKRRRTT
jgi:hypothetical protein